jgi:hypothetical protein
VIVERHCAPGRKTMSTLLIYFLIHPRFPLELVLGVKSYLYETEWINCMNTTKQFQPMKTSTIVFRFSREASVHYYENSGFRYRVLMLLSNPTMQLHLNYFRYRVLEDAGIFTELASINLQDCFRITNVEPLRNIKKINLTGCYRITDVSSLKNCSELLLSCCSGIVDFTCLAHVKVLDLSLCTQIKSVDCFSRCHTINLSKCYQIKDVSMLSGCTWLDLSYCTGIEDVNMLGGLAYINLSYCVQLTSVCGLKNVPELHLVGCTNVLDLNHWEIIISSI